ncbi:MAG TPA: hypothetical protein VMV49_04655, partial [Candidatus Deferrimicrobium sp.]|nr:hypothetical protein [Candidatus Deferrimicrobium sp.]
TDFELYGESFLGLIWVRVTHLSLFTAGGLQNVPYWNYILLFIFIALALLGASVVVYTQHKKIKVVAKKLRRRPMDNLQWEIQDTTLNLKFDITREFGESKSGKTVIVANSHGGWHFKGTDLSLGMIAYKYPITKELKKKPKREMQNIQFKLDENTAVLTIDTTKDFGLSSTGKTKIVASSRGNHHIEGTTIYFGVNVFKSIKDSIITEPKAPKPAPKNAPSKKIAEAPTTEKPTPKNTEPPAKKPFIAEKK